MEKIIGHIELGASFRKDYIEIFINMLNKDERLLSKYNPGKQDMQRLNLLSIYESGEKEPIHACTNLVVFLLNSKPELEYSDFIMEKFKNESSDDGNDNLKIILKAIRSQYLKLTNSFTETVDKLYDMENRFTAMIDEQNTLIKNILNEHSEIQKHLDGKENDIKIINSRITDHVSDVNKIKDKISKIEETTFKMQKLEDFKLN